MEKVSDHQMESEEKEINQVHSLPISSATTTTFSTEKAFFQYQANSSSFNNFPTANGWSQAFNPYNPLQQPPNALPPQPATKPPPHFPKLPITPHSLISSPTVTSSGTPREAQEERQATGSDRKRSRRSLIDDNTLDDIMGQITSKLTSLTTGEEAQQEQSINAFIEVLGCNWTEAAFYLESTAWDIQTAVVLYLENNPSSSSQSWSRQGTIAASRWSAKPRFNEQVVFIDGLDPNWTAKVDPYDGCIYFWNNLTGARQQSVPAGFADLPTQIHPAMFDDNEDGDREDRETASTQRLDEEDGNDVTMHDQGEAIQLPLYGDAIVETHVFGTHSEYWKEDLPPLMAGSDRGRRRNNSENELFEQDNKDIDEDELDATL